MWQTHHATPLSRSPALSVQRVGRPWHVTRVSRRTCRVSCATCRLRRVTGLGQRAGRPRPNTRRRLSRRVHTAPLSMEALCEHLSSHSQMDVTTLEAFVSVEVNFDLTFRSFRRYYHIHEMAIDRQPVMPNTGRTYARCCSQGALHFQMSVSDLMILRRLDDVLMSSHLS